MKFLKLTKVMIATGVVSVMTLTGCSEATEKIGERVQNAEESVAAMTEEVNDSEKYNSYIHFTNQIYDVDFAVMQYFTIVSEEDALTFVDGFTEEEYLILNQLIDPNLQISTSHLSRMNDVPEYVETDEYLEAAHDAVVRMNDAMKEVYDVAMQSATEGVFQAEAAQEVHMKVKAIYDEYNEVVLNFRNGFDSIIEESERELLEVFKEDELLINYHISLYTANDLKVYDMVEATYNEETETYNVESSGLIPLVEEVIINIKDTQAQLEVPSQVAKLPYVAEGKNHESAEIVQDNIDVALGTMLSLYEDLLTQLNAREDIRYTYEEIFWESGAVIDVYNEYMTYFLK